jgi:hypothetical protein
MLTSSEFGGAVDVLAQSGEVGGSANEELDATSGGVDGRSGEVGSIMLPSSPGEFARLEKSRVLDSAVDVLIVRLNR